MKILLGVAVAILAAGIAQAADMPQQAPVYKAAAPATFSWSGFYGGVHGGYGWGKNDVADLTGATSLFDFKPTGGFGGLQIGYNSHFAPHWLIGGEIDSSWGDISDNKLATVAVIPGSSKFDYFGSARTRFGYVQDRSLLYVTGGVAWLHDDFRDGPGLTNASHYLLGWTLGAGWEYAIDNRWSFKLEYLYADFNDSRDVGIASERSFDTNLSTVRVGLNYRFGEMAAAPAYMPVKAAAVRSSWDGGYFGVHGGYGSGNYDARGGGGLATSLEPDGGFGGFQGGANWVFAPNWVFGLETDGSYGDLKDSNAAVRVKLDGLGTARARLGYAFDNVLLYATGGAAYGREKSQLPGFNENKTDHFGWTAGAGVEYKFAPEWSWKVEYLYADLGENDYKSPGVFSHNTRFTVDTVKVGVNYYGPLVERFFAGK